MLKNPTRVSCFAQACHSAVVDSLKHIVIGVAEQTTAIIVSKM